MSSIAKHIVMSSSLGLGSVWCAPAAGDRGGSDESPTPLGVCGRFADSSSCCFCCCCCCVLCRTFWMYLRRTESTIVVSDAVVVCDDISVCSVVQQSPRSEKKTRQSLQPETFVCVNKKGASTNPTSQFHVKAHILCSRVGVQSQSILVTSSLHALFPPDERHASTDCLHLKNTQST